MQWHLDEISSQVSPGAHALLILDRAGWHTTGKLEIPTNITLLPLPPKSPELNPVENIWQFMRDNWLSNRIFKSFDEIVAICCEAWNRLIDQPWKIMSIGLRKWAHRYCLMLSGIRLASGTRIYNSLTAARASSIRPSLLKTAARTAYMGGLGCGKRMALKAHSRQSSYCARQNKHNAFIVMKPSAFASRGLTLDSHLKCNSEVFDKILGGRSITEAFSWCQIYGPHDVIEICV